MRPLAPNTDKGRTVTGDDVHHKTRDTTPGWADGKAKAMRHAARQEGQAAASSISDDDACASCAQGWPATPDADGYITECNQLIDLEYSAIWLQLTAA